MDPMMLIVCAIAVVAVASMVTLLARRRRIPGMGEDPISQAQVYLAYGRDAKAQKILEDALKADPGNAAISALLQSIKNGQMGGDQPVDPISEAEVYLAYGRKAKALEILEEALKADPSNAAISAKLQSFRQGR